MSPFTTVTSSCLVPTQLYLLGFANIEWGATMVFQVRCADHLRTGAYLRKQ